MTNRSVLYELNIQLDAGDWGISVPLDQTLIGPVQYGWDRFCQDPDSLTFGGGLLAGSPLPGTRRMVFCCPSPQWEGFYALLKFQGPGALLTRLGHHFRVSDDVMRSMTVRGSELKPRPPKKAKAPKTA